MPVRIVRLATLLRLKRGAGEEFRTLPLRDKLVVIEQLSMVAEYFQARRRVTRVADDTQDT